MFDDSKYYERKYEDVKKSLWTCSNNTNNYILEINSNNKNESELIVYELCVDYCAVVSGIFDIVN